LDVVTKEAMQAAPNAQSTFLGVLLSAVTKHLPCSALELLHAETTTSASQLEAHLQAALLKQVPENHDIIEHSACQAEEGP
jgi:hypothetical protein